MGRPTDCPKPYQVVTRLDEETKQILDKYCKEKQVTKNDAVRKGIRKLKDDIKK